MSVELENYDTDPRWYHDLADGGDNFKIGFNIYLLTHPERIDAIQKYVGPHLKNQEGALEIYTNQYNSDPYNLFNRGNYIKYMLEYRRFRIMHDLAYNINPPIFKPLTDPDDLKIVDLLAQGKSYMLNPHRSRLKQAQYAEIFERAQRPPGPPPAPPSNTNRPPRGRGIKRYKYI
jgi:hypothetical protein